MFSSWAQKGQTFPTGWLVASGAEKKLDGPQFSGCLYLFSKMHSRYVTDATVAMFVALLLFILPSMRPRCGFCSQNSCDLEEGEEGKDDEHHYFPPSLLKTFRKLFFHLWTTEEQFLHKKQGRKEVALQGMESEGFWGLGCCVMLHVATLNGMILFTWRHESCGDSARLRRLQKFLRSASEPIRQAWRGKKAILMPRREVLFLLVCKAFLPKIFEICIFPTITNILWLE